jgi:putative cell wall-binding protein
MKVLRTLLATAAVLTALAAVPAQAIPRDVVVARAMVWANAVRSRDASGRPTAYGVPYSQKRWAKADGTLIPLTVSADKARYLGWRTDCSGFVAMCWDLRDYLGRPQSPTTMDYRANPSRWYRITKADLKPGDMMLVCAEWGGPYSHAVLFAGWADTAKTNYWAIEESSSKGGVVRRMTPYPYWGTAAAYYRPYRYASIQDDFGDVITSVTGADAYRTAVAASQVSFPVAQTASVPGLIVTSAQDWSYSLSAGTLAAGVRGPVLLASAHVLPSCTAAEIKRLKPGVVYILGSTWSIDSKVAAAIQALGPRVVRVTGADRYALASRVATIGVGLARSRGVAVDTAYLVNGLDYPDAFATSALAVKSSRPILCASAVSLPASTRAALAEMNIKNVVIVGSTATIGSGVEQVLRNRHYTVRRIPGGNHYSVARGLATEGASLGLSWRGVGVTSDRYFQHSLAAGVSQGLSGSMLLMNPATTLDSGVGSDLSSKRAAARPVRVYGSTSSISWAVRKLIASRLRTP